MVAQSQFMEKELRILLLEDCRKDAELILLELESSGLVVIPRCVSTRDEFEAALKDFNPDLVFSDYSLPGFGGIQAMVLAREHAPDLPFILVTGALGEELAVESIRRGATDYILKDRLYQLVPAVLRAVREAEQRTQRREAERILRESEERFRQLAENIHEVFWLTDPSKQQLIYISPGYERIWGRSCESLYATPQNWIESVHPEDRDRVWEAALTKQVAGEYDEIYRIMRPDGSFRWIHDRGFPIRDENGRVYRIAGIAEDITGAKVAEEALRQAEQNYRSIFENAIEGIFQTTPEGRYLSVNPALAENLGYASPEEMIASISDISHQICVDPLTRDELKLRLEQDGYIRDFENQIFRKDGAKIWISVTARAVRDGNGKVLYYEGTSQDITRRKLAEAQVDMLAHAIESAQELISITDHENRVMFANRAFLKAYSYTEAEVLGKKPDFLHSLRAMPGLTEKIYQQTLKGGWDGELVNRRKNGTEFPISLSTSQIRDHQGRVLGLIGVARDISERKRSERETTAFSRLGYRLSAVTSPEEAATIILNIADELFGWNAGYVHLYSAADDKLVPVLTIDLEDGVRQTVSSATFTLDPSPLMREVMKEGARLINRAEGSETGALQHFGDKGRRSASMMYVPIHSSAEVIGLLSIQSYTPNAYTRDDLNVLQALADYCGDALHRIKVAAALFESEEKFRNLFESAPIGITLHDATGRFIHVNTAYQRMLGYTSHELKQLGERVTHPADVAAGQQLFAELCAGQRDSYQREKRYLHKDGHLVWAQSSASAFRNAKGELLYLISMVEDISQRRQVVEALRQSERKLRLIAENTSDVIFAFDMNRTPVYVNPALKELTGYTFAEIQERRFINWIHPDDQERMLELWEGLYQGRGYSEVEFRLITRSGKIKWCSSSWGPLLDEKGQQIGVQGRERDISERKQLEHEVLEIAANERRRIGHELHDGLGQYLAGIAFRAKALEQTLSAEGLLHAAEAHELATLISNAISQSRTLARGLDPVEVESIGLPAALQTLTADISNVFNVECVCSCSDLHFDLEPQTSLALYRIVQEAIHNAITHGEASRIAVELALDQGQLCLRITDNGCGFEEKVSTHHGMGLRVMQYRARSIGGNLSIQSKAGSGSKVSLVVPCQGESHQIPQVAEGQPPY